MNLSDLRPASGSRTAKRRVGRGHGSGRGKTAGHGTKGQKARTGGKIHRAFDGGQTRLSKRLPFVRGLGNSNIPFRDEYTIINVADLELFEPGTRVTPEALVAQHLLTPAEGRGLVKVLGGEYPEYAPLVLLNDFADSALVYEVSVWMHDPWNHRRFRSKLRELIYEACAREKITIAYPQLDVHLGDRKKAA